MTPGSVFRVFFDKPLDFGAIDETNWDIVRLGQEYDPFAASAAGYRVTLNAVLSGVPPEPDGISYAATPPDLIGVNGLAVLPFEKIPFI